jgi:thiol-disulfide isomerase/thioredoxin
LATALTGLQTALLATPLVPCPPADFDGKTVEELEILWAAALKNVAYDEILATFRFLWMTCRFLNLENDFTALYNQVTNCNIDWASRCGDIRQTQEELLEAAEEAAKKAAVEGPLADTVEELREQERLVVAVYNEVEGADMGAGYQYFQIVKFGELKKRLGEIRQKIKHLEAKPCRTCGDTGNWGEAGHCSYYCATREPCWGCRENQPNQLAHMDVGGCLYQEEV